MPKQNGVLVISLDFELQWGVGDEGSEDDFRQVMLASRSVIPLLLETFAEYGIHATWAIVGLLFFETKIALVQGLPDKKPEYVNRKLSTYKRIDSIGSNEEEDPLHYAPSLIRLIVSHPSQEIGTHTFSHYYCLERGQNIEAFEHDLRAAVKAAKAYSLLLESLVFPKNQVNDDYIPICVASGLSAYRGNQLSWIYEARSQENESSVRRLLRLLDAYVNLSGHNCHSQVMLGERFPYNIPGSRFLRPCSRWLRPLEPLRLRRILSDLNCAAKNGLVYHLWWHPHNFGTNLKENIAFLKKVLEHYRRLHETLGMESLNMRELSHRLSQGGVSCRAKQ